MKSLRGEHTLRHAAVENFDEGTLGSQPACLSMSARALEFMDRWTAEHLKNVITDDPLAISDLVDELMTAAKREGIRAKEFHEEVDSVFDVILEAVQHREGGLAG